MPSIAETLETLSTALLVPVLCALALVLLWTLIQLGSFAREHRERRRTRSTWSTFQRSLEEALPRPSVVHMEAFFDADRQRGLLDAFARRGRPLWRSPLHLQHVVDELEIASSARIARMTFGARLGPILGLMGTLIPMGPALLGLSQGHFDEMTEQLVIAFTTTVLGLFVGGACHAMGLVRRHWYARDLADINYLCQCIEEARDA